MAAPPLGVKAPPLDAIDQQAADDALLGPIDLGADDDGDGDGSSGASHDGGGGGGGGGGGAGLGGPSDDGQSDVPGNSGAAGASGTPSGSRQGGCRLTASHHVLKAPLCLQ